MLSEEWEYLKSRVSEICLKGFHVNQGVGVPISSQIFRCVVELGHYITFLLIFNVQGILALCEFHYYKFHYWELIDIAKYKIIAAMKYFGPKNALA